MMEIQTVVIDSGSSEIGKVVTSLDFSDILDGAVSIDGAAKHTLAGAGNTVCDTTSNYA